MKDALPYVGTLAFVLFLIINSILFGYEAAQELVDDNDFDDDEKESKRVKGILSLIEDAFFFRNTIRVVFSITNIFIGIFFLNWYFEAIRKPDISQTYIVTGIILSVILFVILEVFGCIIPASLAKRKPKRYVLKNYVAARGILSIFSPITYVVTTLSSLILKIFGIDINKDNEVVTEEDILDMVNEGQEQGILMDNEANMINNIMDFADTRACDIMTHRKSIEALDGNITLEKAVKYFMEASYSRLPVYEDDIDNIIGVLHFKDAYKQYQDASKRKLTLLAFKDMFIDAPLIPETRNINTLFDFMQDEKVHMAIVVDEYGQTVGLVTMEDILEEIVGNIFDEHDKEDTPIKKQADNAYVVDGLTELDELSKLLDIDFNTDEIDTLNGFMISKIGHVPDKGEKIEIEYEDYIFKTLKVDRNIIKKVRIVKKERLHDSKQG